MLRRLTILTFALCLLGEVAAACMRYVEHIDFKSESADLSEESRSTLAKFIVQNKGYISGQPLECRYVLSILASSEADEESKIGPGLDLKRAEAIRDAAISLGWPRDRFILRADDIPGRNASLDIYLETGGPMECTYAIPSCPGCDVVLPSGKKCAVL